MQLQLGVKTDPVLYRYSYEWLFGIMRDMEVTNVQLGTFFELYQLPDRFFIRLRALAEQYGLRIRSLFTSHRELGGFFSGDEDLVAVAYRNYGRLIEIGSLLGVDYVGSNPGSVLRDRMDTKIPGLSCYLQHMNLLQNTAHRKGLKGLTMEPMSSLAEPPTLPEELETMMGALKRHHGEHCTETVPAGFCLDVAHGYADADLKVRNDHITLLNTAIPHLFELHLKNTDELYNATFGFSENERKRGLVDMVQIVHLLHQQRDHIPVDTLVGYLEIGGPKLGRDYSDPLLERQLRDSLGYLKEVFR